MSHYSRVFYIRFIQEKYRKCFYYGMDFNEKWMNCSDILEVLLQGPPNVLAQNLKNGKVGTSKAYFTYENTVTAEKLQTQEPWRECAAFQFHRLTLL